MSPLLLSLSLALASHVAASPVWPAYHRGPMYPLHRGPMHPLHRGPMYPLHRFPIYPAQPRLETVPVVLDIEDIDFKCEAEGIFVNEEDCGSYFICNNNGAGYSVAKVSCQPGLVFNAQYMVCDFLANVPECAGRTVATSTNPTPPIQPVVACTEFDRVGRPIGEVPCISAVQACEDGTFRASCEPVSDTWWWTVEENPEGFDCTDRAVGKYEDPSNCDKFLVCSGDGRAYRYSCATGTYFDVKTGECGHEDQVECASREART